jgi:Fic family protein
MHYQFEAIHPFLDGNGRVGRLLIVLFLCIAGRLPSPVLYLSPFFERHRQQYYDSLRGVSERSAWNDWLSFFLRGVIVQCRDAFFRSSRMSEMHNSYRQELLRKKAPPTALNLLEQLFLSPATTVGLASRQLGVTVVSATRAVQLLCSLGILAEVTGRKRDRIFLAERLIEALEAESDVESKYAS